MRQRGIFEGAWTGSLLGAGLLLLCAVPAEAATRYVDGVLASDCTSGNYSIANRNCTGSNGNAYTTFAEGVAATGAGDTLYVRAGTYLFTDGFRSFPTTCTATQRCTFSAYPGPHTIGTDYPGKGTYERVIFKLADSVPKGGFVFFNFQTPSRSYQTLKGLIVDANGKASIAIRADTSTSGGLADGPVGLWMIDNEVMNAHGQGILDFGTAPGIPGNHIVRGNKVHHHGDTVNLDHGLYFKGNYSLIEHNDFYENCASGVQIQYTSAYHNVFRSNRVHNNDRCNNGDASMWVSEGAQHNDVYGNVFYNDPLSPSRSKSGIHVVYRDPDDGKPVDNNHFYNNTFYGIVKIGGLGSGHPIHVDRGKHVVRNNIFFGNTTNDAVVIPQFGTTLITGVITKSNNFTSDPQFTNPAASDFRLKAGSGAIDYGTATICSAAEVSSGLCSPTITLSGYVGPAPDAGALEFGSGAPLPGDLNGDGVRNIIDVRWIIEMLVGSRPKATAADLDRDGDVDLADCQALIRLIVGVP